SARACGRIGRAGLRSIMSERSAVKLSPRRWTSTAIRRTRSARYEVMPGSTLRPSSNRGRMIGTTVEPGTILPRARTPQCEKSVQSVREAATPRANPQKRLFRTDRTDFAFRTFARVCARPRDVDNPKGCLRSRRPLDEGLSIEEIERCLLGKGARGHC